MYGVCKRKARESIFLIGLWPLRQCGSKLKEPDILKTPKVCIHFEQMQKLQK